MCGEGPRDQYLEFISMTRDVDKDLTAFFAASPPKENNQGRKEAQDRIAVVANSVSRYR
jgi:hypothetical protein